MEFIFFLVLIFYSIIFHEISHGFVAYKLGDPTAKNSGRLSLNPLAHIDPIGTILLPFFTFFYFNFIFGYAKPVPYNPLYFKNPRRDSIFVALAGPITNLLLMLLFLYLYKLDFFPSLTKNFLSLAQLNFNLALFNLIPIPPLDGSKLFLLWMSLEEYIFLETYGFVFIFLFLLFLGNYFFIISYKAFKLILSLLG